MHRERRTGDPVDMVGRAGGRGDRLGGVAGRAPDVEGVRAMDDKQQARRVLNLIHNVGQGKGGVKQWAVLKLLRWQPLAKRIRFAGKCHCKHGQMLTYQLDGVDHERGANEETCGYYCPNCGFGNAGSRERRVGR